MHCRPCCGACCIAPSISQPFFGMPAGKPAGTPCVHLQQNMSCGLFADPRRPALCADFKAEEATCGENREQALLLIGEMEILSTPDYRCRQ